MQQIEKIVIGLFIEQSLLNFEPIEAQNFNRLHGSDAQILIVQLEGLVDKVEVGEDVGLVLVLFKHVRPPEGR